MSILTLALEELARSARSLKSESARNGSTGLKEYRSTLSACLADVSESKVQEVSKDELAEAILLWKKCKRNDELATLSKRTYRILSSEPKMLQDDIFCYHISTQLAANPRLMIPLLLSHHRIWKSNPLFKEVDLLFETVIKDYLGKNRLISSWKENAKFVVGKDSAAKLAEELIVQRLPFTEFVNKFNLILDNSAFAADVQRQACALASQALHFKKQFYEPLWRYILGPLLQSHSVTKQLREETLAAAMLAISGYSPESKAIAIDLLKDYILPHPEFGDPRLYPAKWNSFPQQAKQQFVAWLSEEDIRLFFDLIIKNDTGGRKAFWLKYAKRMRSSSVVLSGKDKYENGRKLMELSAKGRVFQEWSTFKESSTFIMNFGEFVAVEFSDIGNACFVYDSVQFQELFGSMHNLSVRRGSLLKSEKAKFRQPHPFGWETKLSTKLAELGIRQGM